MRWVIAAVLAHWTWGCFGSAWEMRLVNRKEFWHDVTLGAVTGICLVALVFRVGV